MSSAPRSISKPEPAWDPSIAERLLSALGLTLTAVLSGSPGPDVVTGWASSAGSAPTDEQARRMRLAVEVWDQLEESDGADVARLWFLGANPTLGDSSAVEAISQDRFHSVRAAAENFVLGG